MTCGFTLDTSPEAIAKLQKAFASAQEQVERFGQSVTLVIGDRGVTFLPCEETVEISVRGIECKTVTASFGIKLDPLTPAQRRSANCLKRVFDPALNRHERRKAAKGRK